MYQMQTDKQKTRLLLRELQSDEVNNLFEQKNSTSPKNSQVQQSKFKFPSKSHIQQSKLINNQESPHSELVSEHSKINDQINTVKRFKQVTFKHVNIVTNQVKQESLDIEIFNTDKIQSIQFKIAQFYKTQPSTIFICIQQVQNKHIQLMPFKYYIYDQNIPIIPPLQILSELQNKQENDGGNFKIFGKIPLRKDLLMSFQKQDDDVFLQTHTIQSNAQFMSDLFQLNQELVIQIMLLSDIQQDAVYSQIISNQINLQIIQHCLIMQYFPFVLLQSSQNIFRQDRLEFFQKEIKQTQLAQQYIKSNKDKLQNVYKKYFVNSIKYQIQVRSFQVELKQLFNEIELQSFMDLQLLQYFYFKDGEQFVVSKQQIFKQQVPIHQFYDEEINGYGEDYYFKITRNGLIEFVLYVKDVFADYPKQQESRWREQFEDFIYLFNKYKIQFSSQEIVLSEQSIEKYIDLIIYLFGLDNVGFLQFSIEQSLQKQSDIFIPQIQYKKSHTKWKSYILFNQGYTFQIRTESAQLQILYTGIHHKYVDVLTQIILANSSGDFKLEKQQLTDDQLTKQLIKNDPVLFTNLKNIQYSRVCQGNKKPINVDQQQGNNIYEYWNFTSNKPQYYKCQDPYSFLYFRTGHHQDGYCLPCCSATDPQKTQAKRNKYNKCLQNRVSNEEQRDSTKYAFKNTENFQVGRLTMIDNDSFMMCFKQKLKDTVFIHCLSFPQNLPNTRDIIMLFLESISYLVQLDGLTLLDKLDSYFKKHETPTIINAIYNLRQTNSMYEFSFEQWFVYLSGFINDQYSANLVLLKRDQISDKYPIKYTVSANVTTIEKQKSFFLLQIRDTINPVVFTEHQLKTYVMKDSLKFISQIEDQIQNQTHYTAQQISINFEQLNLQKTYQIVSQIVNFDGFCVNLLLKNVINKHLIIIPTDQSVPIIGLKQIEQIPPLSTFQNKESELMGLLQLYNMDVQNQQAVYQEMQLVFNTIQKSSHIDKKSHKNKKDKNDSKSQAKRELGSEEICGFFFKDLFFYTIIQPTSELLQHVQLISPINFNPLYINYLIANQTPQEFKTSKLQYNQQILKSIYINYLYKLLKMQIFTAQTQTMNKQASPKQEDNKNRNSEKSLDLDKYFVFMDIQEIYKLIHEYLLSKKNESDIPEFKQLTSCIKTPGQFFCSEQRMVLPTGSQPYFQMLAREKTISNTQNFKQYFMILISDFEFKKQSDEFIMIHQLDKQKWKHNK